MREILYCDTAVERN